MSAAYECQLSQARRYRGGCKQEQQNGEGLKVLYGTETAKGKSVGSVPCTSLCKIYGIGSLALAERHEEKLQIKENNWVRRICQVKREERKWGIKRKDRN